MSREGVVQKNAWIALAVLLAMPSVSRATSTSENQLSLAPPSSIATVLSQAAAPSTPAPEVDADRDDERDEGDQDAQDREQEKRDREQEARDREQERREREQEKRDREQEKLDRAQELYEQGREDLDEDRYQRAESRFNELAQRNGPQTDAALYWKAYAENRLGKRNT